MSLDFQQVYVEVKKLGEDAIAREESLKLKRDEALQLLKSQALEMERLRHKVEFIASHFDPSLRCAVPVNEPLDAHLKQPGQPVQATILAADGSQIAPDRHAEVSYCMINVGAIQLRVGSPEPPITTTQCRLMYGNQLYTRNGVITDASLALMRDLNERKMLLKLTKEASPPVISFTDGPMELWGAKVEEGGSPTEYQKSLAVYLDVLRSLNQLGVITGGYVDKPGADLVVRLLEVVSLSEAELPNVKESRPLQGVSEEDLFSGILGSGERSAVFKIQSQSARNYPGDLALHFFYLNVGLPEHPHLARVEVPKWVADDPSKLNSLHATLVEQCRIMGSRPYPYLLHRAHEVAVVSLEEKDQVTQMILLELRRRGAPVGDKSNKQFSKELSGRTRYTG